MGLSHTMHCAGTSASNFTFCPRVEVVLLGESKHLWATRFRARAPMSEHEASEFLRHYTKRSRVMCYQFNDNKDDVKLDADVPAQCMVWESLMYVCVLCSLVGASAWVWTL